MKTWTPVCMAQELLPALAFVSTSRRVRVAPFVKELRGGFDVQAEGRAPCEASYHQGRPGEHQQGDQGDPKEGARGEEEARKAMEAVCIPEVGRAYPL